MSSAFHLQVQDDGLATLIFDAPGKTVNVFSRQVLAELEALVSELSDNGQIRCLVLLSGKERSFIAGADIEEIRDVLDPDLAAEGARFGQRIFDDWSRLPFPTIAAVRGTCLGGGTEWSLACHHILISDRDDVRIGLPEVRIGIVPAWGGCSRLPSRVGLTAALDIILAGKAVHPRKAFKIGLADALLPDAGFLHHVRAFTGRVMQGSNGSRRKTDLKALLLERNPVGRNLVFKQARKRVLEQTKGHYPAPLRALEVVDVGIASGLHEGLDAEARAVGELAVSPTCKNLLHVFGLMEGVKKLTFSAKPNLVSNSAVLGAGVMGGGIAQLIAAKADIPIRLKDVSSDPLANGMEHAAALFDKQVKRRRLSQPEAMRKMNLLRPTLTYEGFETADLVIEAIVESLEIKQKVLAEVSHEVSDNTILASNTSSLSIDLIARDCQRPDRVVGMHFFNPVHRMPLVEVIRGARTSARAVSTVAEFARRLGKTPIVVADGPGFLVNRLLGFYLTEALWLLDEGYAVEDIDQTMLDWGMPMGPMALTDDIGLDVAVKVSHILADAFGDRLPLTTWSDRLADSSRLGTKTGLGIYTYKGADRQRPDRDIYGLLGLPSIRRGAAGGRLVDRMVLPMVNEAARCLEERIVASPADVDLAMIMGTGYPPFRGGLCRWADEQGIEQVMTSLETLATEVGARFAPSEALRKAAAAGGMYRAFGSA